MGDTGKREKRALGECSQGMCSPVQTGWVRPGTSLWGQRDSGGAVGQEGASLPAEGIAPGPQAIGKEQTWSSTCKPGRGVTRALTLVQIHLAPGDPGSRGPRWPSRRRPTTWRQLACGFLLVLLQQLRRTMGTSPSCRRKVGGIQPCWGAGGRHAGHRHVCPGTAWGLPGPGSGGSAGPLAFHPIRRRLTYIVISIWIPFVSFVSILA